MNTRMTLIGTIVVGAALLAPVAQAQRPDDRPGLRGPGAVTAPQDAASSHPDNGAEARGPGAVAAVGLSVPPDAFERHRNDVIFTSWQHNRNPFIDHPEWAASIWA